MPASSSASKLKRAHVALAVTFVAFGALDGTWAARLPALKHRLGLDSGQLGLGMVSTSPTYVGGDPTTTPNNTANTVQVLPP